MARVVNATEVKGQVALSSVKPGNSVQVIWDGRTTTYMICKSNDETLRPNIIELVNLETGRYVRKPGKVLCKKVSVTITIEEMQNG